MNNYSTKTTAKIRNFFHIKEKNFLRPPHKGPFRTPFRLSNALSHSIIPPPCKPLAKFHPGRSSRPHKALFLRL